MLGTAAATAAPAYASATVNVRAGAGTGFPVVDVLRPGDAVEIDHCRGSWCFVDTGSGDGWVSARYLTADRVGYGDRYSDRDYYDEPRVVVRPRSYYRPYRSFYGPYGGFYGGPSFGSSVCAGGPNMSFCVGN